jgi:Cu+-exporting ATPase
LGAAVASSHAAGAACFHCGTPCLGEAFHRESKSFCCQGCLTVFELLTENGLGDFYQMADSAGVRVKATREEQFRYLDAPAVREQIVDFQDQRLTRITLRVPAIHCVACIWLLENLFQLRPGIGSSQVNFARKEVSICFENARLKLSELVALLASLGYEPELKLADLGTGRRAANPAARRLWMQIGYAGFAFLNLMMFSLSIYFGMDTFTGPTFQRLVGWISFVLAVPVVTYSALDYWRNAWTSLRQKRLAIEVPIALGIAVIFVQSAFDVTTGRGEGYFDSLCGLIFFLLCGRLFQQKTFDRLSFERDYKSFFPLSVTRRGATGEEEAALAQLQVGDRLIIRNGQLVPADSRLVSGTALIDYSFVTGESEPVAKSEGEHLYAGGRHIGAAIEIETTKAVSQSYLTSLWNQEAFRKAKGGMIHTLTNVYSYRFTKIIIGIALAAAVFWMVRGDGVRAFKAFTSVLIVACPCALALAAPFTLGTAIRVLGRRKVFVKSPDVVETLARVDAVVFDKTGTLTAAGAGSVNFSGAVLGDDERRWLYSLARQSTHPLAVRMADALEGEPALPVRSFTETTGCGIEGVTGGHEILLGSAAWLRSRGIVCDPPKTAAGGVVCVAVDGRFRGTFLLTSALRPETERLVRNLSANHELALLSGDNERERARFTEIFGAAARMEFNQSPLLKFEFIEALQRSGRTVMMVGDGLNDAGALKQSHVGVAVVENVSAFSPASDIIMSAGMVPRLHEVLRYSKRAVRIVRLSFGISSLYNVVGIGIAAAGLLSPVVCAILMPVSSITVVAFACGMTAWAGRSLGNEE